MKDFTVLKILDRFRGIFGKFGVDYDVMRKILQVKLIMDGRRVPTIMSNSSKKKDETKNKDENKFIKSLWVYGLLGIIMLPFVLMGENYIFQMGVVFGILMFMITSSLISDFSSVLLDIRDKNIIFSKPVHSKTLSMAKTIHIFIYMFFITISVTGIPLLAALIKHGIAFFLLFLLELILMDLLIVVITALLYLFVLKFFDGEKLKDIINYVQIGLSITIAVGYQLLIRLFNFVDFTIAFTPKWWQYFIVPIWYGAPFEVLLHGNYNVHYITFSILAVLVPIVSIMMYIKLMPSFERNLQKLTNNSMKGKTGKRTILGGVAKLICSGKEEKTFFRFASDMMKNEREFKLKVYPSLGFALIFPFIFIFNGLRDDGFESIASSRLYLNIYFCALLIPSVVMMLKYSGKYKGAWIYKVAPLKDMVPVFKGTLKAFIVRLLLPVYMIESVLFLSIFGIRIVPDLFVVFLVMLLFIVICFRMFGKSLPFSEAYETAQQSEGLMIIPLMFMLGALAGVHYACSLVGYGVYVYMAVVLLLNVVAWKKGFSIGWDKLNK